MANLLFKDASYKQKDPKLRKAGTLLSLLFSILIFSSSILNSFHNKRVISMQKKKMTKRYDTHLLIIQLKFGLVRAGTAVIVLISGTLFTFPLSLPLLLQ